MLFPPQKAFKHAAVHLEEREGPAAGGRVPWWAAALGKGARKHRGHGHGHGHIKTQHHKHQDEVRVLPRRHWCITPAKR